ncbi:hypothetical protein FO519_007386, partial [Halicephalobus sp. NKZ332]
DGCILCSSFNGKGDSRKIHQFCIDCIKGIAKSATEDAPIADGGIGLPCPVEECQNVLHINNFEFYLDSNIYTALIRRFQEEAIIAAEMDDLVTCPGCHMKFCVDSNLKFYDCHCGRRQCRKCPRVYDAKHDNISCSKLDELDRQRVLEPKLSEIAVRVCHRCKLQFVKEDGCNKMECRCKALQCYLCRQPVEDYSHFCECGWKGTSGKCPTCSKSCPLWGDPEERDRIQMEEVMNASEDILCASRRWPISDIMPTYNTRDAKGRTEELDPCIAAEIRVKNNTSRRTYLAIVIAIFITLLTILAVALIIYFSQASGSPPTGDAAGPWYEDQSVSVNEEKTTTTENPADDPDDEYDDEPPSNRAYGGTTIVDDGPTNKFKNDFAPMTPSGNPYVSEPRKEPDVNTAFVFPPAATTTYSPTFKSTSRLMPSTTSSEPVAVTMRSTVEVSTYSTKSDETLDIVPSFSSIDDRKYDFIETDDLYENCEEYKKAGHDRSGVYEIKIGETQFRALCLMEADYAWMVLQRRSNGQLSFNRSFDEYADGFGSPSVDHWLGLEKVYIYSKLGHRLQMRIELRGDLCSENNKCSGFGKNGYWWGDWNFALGPRKMNYKLTVEPTVHGNLSDSSKDPLYELNNGQQFTTFGADNDKSKRLHCALFRGNGAWWHKDCTFVALNGEYGMKDGKTRGMHWFYQKKSEGQNGALISYAIKPEKSLIKFRVKA